MPSEKSRVVSTTMMILCAAVIVTVAMGIRQSFGLMMRPITLDLGIGRQDFGLALAFQNLLFGLVQPFVGAYADKHGAGRVIAFGTALYAGGLVLAGVATDTAMLHLTMGLLIGLAMSGTTFVVVFGPVARAVSPERRTLALGIVTAGGSLGQFLVVPAAQGLLQAFDWRMTLTILAVLAATMAALGLGVAGKPQPQAAAEGPASAMDALREAMGNRSYWLLLAGFFVCGFHIAFVGTHLPAYVSDRGLAAEVGAWSLALIGLFNIFGSYLFGAWGGRWSKKNLLSALYAGRAVLIAVFLLTPLSPLSVLLFSAGFGFLWLGTVPLTSGLISQIFGARHMSMLYGIVFLSHQVGSFIGAWWAGQAFDATGSYDAVWLVSIALGVTAAILHLPIVERPLVRPATA